MTWIKDCLKYYVQCMCGLYVFLVCFRLLGGYSDASLYNGSLAKIRCDPGKLRH